MLRRFLPGLARVWARRRLAGQTTVAPLQVLRALLGQAVVTRYGLDHRFVEILDAPDLYARFCENVPVIDSDAWVAWLGPLSPVSGPAQPLVDQAWPGRISTFCLSSGTTSGRTKYVPYSDEMAAVNRKAAMDMFAYLVAVAPQIVTGKSFYMTGSTNLEVNANGSLCGDMSALSKYLAPRMMERFILPPRAISNLEPWSRRLEALVAMCKAEPRIASLSGIPIWQLTLLEAIQQQVGDLRQVLPELRFLIHGGMSISPYRDRLRALLGERVQFIEIYAASETGITAFTVPGESGMRFWQNYQVFYEFEDDSGRITTSEGVKPGVAYTLIVSTCSGLWRYRIGDRVVFRQTQPLILDYVTRDKTTSAFDEKVTERELEHAMGQVQPSFADFSLGPDVPNRRHIWFLVGNTHPGTAWVEQLDACLRQGNQDYDDYRGDGRIHAPLAVMVPDRAAFLNLLGRAEGGQRKFPRLLNGPEVAQAFKAFGGDAC